MADRKKKKIINSSTIIDSSFLQPIFGGDPQAATTSPDFAGHFHDNGNEWGHAPKIDLTQHTTGRITLSDEFAVVKSINSYPTLTASTREQTLPNMLTSVIWYFAIPTDMDITKTSYFSFEWMGDILTVDDMDNPILDPAKLSSGLPLAQTSTFRITWQWYPPGYAIFAPAIIYDGYTPASIVGTNINQNTLTRGRINNLVINELPFRLMVNDSSINSPGYVTLTGLQQTTNAVMLGVQVDLISTGFITLNPPFPQSGNLKFFQGNFIYISKTMGSSNVLFKTL